MWAVWCDSHPAPRITVVFLVVVLMLAALALTRPAHASDAGALGAPVSVASFCV